MAAGRRTSRRRACAYNLLPSMGWPPLRMPTRHRPKRLSDDFHSLRRDFAGSLVDTRCSEAASGGVLASLAVRC